MGRERRGRGVETLGALGPSRHGRRQRQRPRSVSPCGPRAASPGPPPRSRNERRARSRANAERRARSLRCLDVGRGAQDVRRARAGRGELRGGPRRPRDSLRRRRRARPGSITRAGRSVHRAAGVTPSRAPLQPRPRGARDGSLPSSTPPSQAPRPPCHGRHDLRTKRAQPLARHGVRAHEARAARAEARRRVAVGDAVDRSAAP